MQLILGLGNPGRRYGDTRHNVGFRCVQRFAQDLGLVFYQQTPEYSEAVGDGPAGPVTLLQPLTYMNRSGEAVIAWAERQGVTVGSAVPPRPEDPMAEEGSDQIEAPVPPEVVPIVVCDDLNLPLGSIRIRAAGRDGGQNGLASVISACGGDRVPRLRLGVGPRAGMVSPEIWADYVLQDFAPDEVAAAEDLIDAGAAALGDILVEGPQRAGSHHNRRIRLEPDLPPND